MRGARSLQPLARAAIAEEVLSEAAGYSAASRAWSAAAGRSGTQAAVQGSARRGPTRAAGGNAGPGVHTLAADLVWKWEELATCGAGSAGFTLSGCSATEPRLNDACTVASGSSGSSSSGSSTSLAWRPAAHPLLAGSALSGIRSISTGLASMQGRGLAWPPGWHRSLASSSSSGSSSSDDDSDSDGDDDSDSEAPTVRNRRGKVVPVPPELAAQLAPLAEQCGLADASGLAAAVAALDTPRQKGVVQHGSEVARHLQGLGLGQEQLRKLLLRCPYLFSLPADTRAGLLFGQLQAVGLTAGEAAKCFKQRPEAAGAASFQPGIDVMGALCVAAAEEDALANGDEVLFGAQEVGQLLYMLLKGQPAAVKLLHADSSVLQHRFASLRQRGLSAAQIAKGLLREWTLLQKTPERINELAAVLQQELGVDAGQFAKLLWQRPQLLRSSPDRLQERMQALAEGFGNDVALGFVRRSPPLVTADPSTWRLALFMMRLCGVPDPLAVAGRNPQVLYQDWLAVGSLVNRLALQRWLGLTAGQVYEQFAGYVVACNQERLTGRLLWLTELGVQHLVVPDKAAARREWRRERGLPASLRVEAAGEPGFISVSDVATLQDGEFCALPGVQAAGNSAAALQAFTAGLDSNAAWQELQQGAKVEVARLSALLPPELNTATVAAKGRRRVQKKVEA